MPTSTNRTEEAQLANAYPHVRIFSVGHATSSITPLRDLQTVWEPWQVVSNTTLLEDYGPGHTLFGTFSAVCWFFGRRLADELAANGTSKVPIGLISANLGGHQARGVVAARAVRGMQSRCSARALLRAQC